MANENVNLANRLNNVKNIISNFENFQEFFNKSDERNQEAIINILENLPKDIKEYGKSFTENLRINYVILNLFGDNGSGLCSENINIAINGELILQDFRNKGYISSKESYELSQTMRELLRGGMSYYLNNSNAKEFVDFLQKNRNSDSLKKDNSCLFEEGERLLKKNDVEILKEKNLEEERDKKFEDILKETKKNQPDKYDLVSEIMSVAYQYGKSRCIRDALLESYEKNAANGTKGFDMGINKTIKSIIDKIIYLNPGINVDFKKIVEMVITLNPEDQNKLDKIFKTGSDEYIKKITIEVMNCNENGDTKRINIVIAREFFLQKLRERSDSKPAERKKFKEVINGLSNESAQEFVDFLNEGIGRVKTGKIPVLLGDVECLAALEKIKKFGNSVPGIEKLIDIFDPRDKNSENRKFINEKTINKLNKIFEKVPQNYAERFTADLINLYGNGATERMVIVINKEFLLLQLHEQVDFTKDDRRIFSQTVNGLNNESAKSLIDKINDALRNNIPRKSIMPLINKEAMKVGINVQHRPLQIVNANKMQRQNPSKNTQLMDAI